MIVATAGHIDHGKTLLVKTLTGVDTDRLPEEKARGISIDLGFAYLPLPNGELIGFVDVPGHERFVRNMLAGVCGIEYALLVVAADDGVMPQTVEHLAILDLLEVSRGICVITKVDRVPPARVEETAAAVRELVASTRITVDFGNASGAIHVCIPYSALEPIRDTLSNLRTGDAENDNRLLWRIESKCARGAGDDTHDEQQTDVNEEGKHLRDSDTGGSCGGWHAVPVGMESGRLGGRGGVGPRPSSPVSLGRGRS